MQINRLEVKNFRCFEAGAWDFTPRFNLLAGKNASGKTAILEAVTTAFNAFAGPLFRSDRVNRPDDIRRTKGFVGDSALLYAQYPMRTRFVGELGGQPASWTWEVSETRSNFGHRRHSHVIPDGKDILETLTILRIAATTESDFALPLVVNFPCDRLTDLKPTSKKLDGRKGTRLIGYQAWEHSAFSLATVIEWFRDMEGRSLQAPEPLHSLQGAKNAVLRCVPDAKAIRYDFTEQDLMIERRDLPELPFRLLSHGYRMLIAMVANIAWRCAVLNPQFLEGASEQTKGIVLIDEIDLHLHPMWQRRVVEDLCAAFPKLQFIATSHSPFLIQYLDPDRGDRLINLDDSSADDVQNKSIEEIAEENQGVEGVQRSQRFQDMVAAAEEYYRVLQQTNGTPSAEVEGLKARLDELLLPYSDDPAYVAFLRMERAATGVDGGA